MIAASSTEPTVGASVWASGSQVWNGNIGTLIAKPRNMPPNIEQLRAVHDAVAVQARRA